MVDLPTLPVVIATAAVDAINPCAIGVLVLLIATLIGMSNNKKKMLMVGGIYIAAVFTTYLAAGFGLLVVIQQLHPRIAEFISYIVGGLVIVLGLVEIKDFFWYGKGLTLQIPARRAKQIQEKIKNVSIPGAIVLGAFVAAVELPCTGGPYLAITTLLAKQGLSWAIFWLLLLYNFIFVLPLIVILISVFFGLTPERVQAWKNSKRKWMRLWMGLIMVALGVVLILIANGTINLTLHI